MATITMLHGYVLKVVTSAVTVSKDAQTVGTNYCDSTSSLRNEMPYSRQIKVSILILDIYLECTSSDA